MDIVLRAKALAAVPALVILATACGGGGAGSFAPASTNGGATAQTVPFAEDATSVLKTLKKQVVIGTLVDPVNGAVNPYGLAIAPITSGKMTAGDMVVCDFNDKKNVQGTGKSLLVIHPQPGSTPVHLSSAAPLLGCAALALGSDDTVWGASMVANDDFIADPTGKIVGNIKGKPFDKPFGQIFAQPKSGSPAFYATNEGNGAIIRINLGNKFTYDVIGAKFPTNHGVAGTGLCPTGLAYDAKHDRLYFVDGDNNTLVAFDNVSKIPNGGIVASKNGMSFSGPSAKDAHVIFSGAPLNGPISTALLPNGNIVAGNTGNPSGMNLMVEISSSGKLLDVLNVDKGAAGSIFGMVATGTSDADTKLYFNDDNNNNLQVLER